MILFSDVKNQIADLNQNYTVSTIDKGNIDRAANRAIEWVQQRMGLPSDRKIFSFYYYEDTPFVNLPTGFNEKLQLYYNRTNAAISKDNNYYVNRWFSAEDVEILRSSGQDVGQNKYAFTTINGANQLLLQCKNIVTAQTINPFESTSGLTFTSDITGVTIDSNVVKTGTGSLAFNIDTSLSETAVTYSGLWDIRANLSKKSSYRLYVWIPTGGLSAISSYKLWAQSSTGNYYEMTTTTQADGSALVENTWNLLSFSLANYTMVGAPDASQINALILKMVHSGSFTALTSMRFDNLYIINPDLMDFVYYSSYKGTDTTGATQKIILDQDSDICSFGNFAPDLLYPISLKGALILWPQLRLDVNFQQIYKQECDEVVKLYGKRYPRRRITSSSIAELIR